MRVVLGAHNLLNSESTQVTVISNSTWVHEEWDDIDLVNDIGIVELPFAVKLTGKDIPGETKGNIFHPNFIVLTHHLSPILRF